MSANRKLFLDAKQGDSSAIREIVKICDPLVESECRKFGLDQLAAITVSDLMQEATMHVLDKLNHFDGHDSPNPMATFDCWVRKVTRNYLLNWIDKLKRRQRNQRSLSPLEEAQIKHLDDSTLSVGAVLSRLEENQRVVEAIEIQLDNSCQEIIRLKIVDGYSFVEIAKKLGMSVDQVRYRYHQSLTKLGSCLNF